MAKKKIKKQAKKKKAVSVKNNSMALATISYNDIVKPDIFDNKIAGGKGLHLLKSHFSKNVINFINMPTPKKYILKREGSGKRMFDYIPGWYARKCANYAFGFNHSFEIKNKQVVGLSAVVEGRLIVTDPKTGREILHKDDIGGHKIQFLKDKAKIPENAVDLANDYKAATTDCLKRCMVQIGFFKDVYGLNEVKEDKDSGVKIDIEESEPASERVIDVEVTEIKKDKKAVRKCEGVRGKGCGYGVIEISEAAYQLTKKLFGKGLCRDCFKDAKATKK